MLNTFVQIKRLNLANWLNLKVFSQFIGWKYSNSAKFSQSKAKGRLFDKNKSIAAFMKYVASLQTINFTTLLRSKQIEKNHLRYTFLWSLNRFHSGTDDNLLHKNRKPGPIPSSRMTTATTTTITNVVTFDQRQLLFFARLMRSIALNAIL